MTAALGSAAAVPAPPPYPRWAPPAPKNGTTPPPVPASSCTCATGYALSVQQGATLSVQITLSITDPVTGVKTPVDITGNEFQFTAKPTPETLDTDPSVVTIDWQETSTPTQGITWLVVPAATTQTMQLIAYAMQVRMVSSSGVVTPLTQGTITITQPISSRF